MGRGTDGEGSRGLKARYRPAQGKALRTKKGESKRGLKARHNSIRGTCIGPSALLPDPCPGEPRRPSHFHLGG
jgi:hypothetical protein